MGVTEQIDALWKEITDVPQVKIWIKKYSKSKGVEHSKRVYDCSSCKHKRCCRSTPICSIYDAAKLMDAGLGDYLEGTLEPRVRDENRLHIRKNGSACAFLESGKCAHYELRPGICRLYPYAPVKDKLTFAPVLCATKKGKIPVRRIQEAAQEFDFEIARTHLLLTNKREEIKATELGRFLD